MKNSSLSVMIHGFPKLGTVLSYLNDYKVSVIGYENQMSIIDLLFLKKGKMFLLKAKYNLIISEIYLNKIKIIGKNDSFKLVNKVDEMKDGKFYLTKDGFVYILEGKNLALEVLNNTARAFYCDGIKENYYYGIKENYYYEVADKQLIVNILSDIINTRMYSYLFFGSKERISSYVKQFTLRQLIEYLTKDGSFSIKQDTITASLIKLKDEISKNNI